MQDRFLKHKWFFLAAVGGAIAGFFYWQQIGCLSGACAITSSPVNSTLYGALFGWLVAGLFKTTAKSEGLDEKF